MQEYVPLEPMAYEWRPPTSKGYYRELPALLQLDPGVRPEEVENAIAQLKAHPVARRDMAVIAWRFPAFGEPPTLKEIGAQLGLGRERIRQMTVRGLRRIRGRVQSRRRR